VRAWFERTDVAMSVPCLCDAELISGLRSATRRDELSRSAAQDALGVYQDLRLVRHEHRPLLRRALGLETFSTYDAIYVALAERLGAPLLTTDGRLARAVVTTRGVNVSLA